MAYNRRNIYKLDIHTLFIHVVPDKTYYAVFVIRDYNECQALKELNVAEANLH